MGSWFSITLSTASTSNVNTAEEANTRKRNVTVLLKNRNHVKFHNLLIHWDSNFLLFILKCHAIVLAHARRKSRGKCYSSVI